MPRIGRLPKGGRSKKSNKGSDSQDTASVRSDESRGGVNSGVVGGSSSSGGNSVAASVNTPRKRKARATLKDTTNSPANRADDRFNLTKRQKTSVGKGFNFASSSRGD